MRYLRKNKGITLIALVITIIVLLILAGVAISMLSGENGILRKAAEAKQSADREQKLETIRLAIISSLTNTNHKVDKTALEQELEKEFGEIKVLDINDEFIIEIGQDIYRVDSNGELYEGPYSKGTINSDIGEVKISDLSNGKITDYKIYGKSIDSEYQQVEYIESTGTQYIDTHIPHTEVHGYEIEFQSTGIKKSISAYNVDGILGVNNSECDTKLWFSYNEDENTAKNSIILLKGSVSTDTISLDEYYSNKHKISVLNGNVSYDDLDIGQITPSEASDAFNIYVFAVNDSDSGLKYYSKTKIYSLKLYGKDNELIANYIPCYRTTDNVKGLYNTVNNEFYTNSGTGVFLKGNDVENSSINTSTEIKSVGDKVTEGEYKGKYKIPVTVNGKNLFNIASHRLYSGYYADSHGAAISNSTDKFMAITDGIKVEPLTTYTLSCNLKIYTIWYASNNNCWANDGGAFEKKYIYYNSTTFTTPEDCHYIRVSLQKENDPTGTTDFKWMQLEKGTEKTEYTPYIEPVTTNIYLNEPLRQVGNYTDYIDFANRKLVRQVEVLEDGTLKGLEKEVLTDIKLPTIPTLEGTNIITIGTRVKPSNFEIKYITKTE